MAIPKIIHYFYDDVDIWEKNSKSQVRMCINSWLNVCPESEYKYILWHDKMPEFQEILQKSEFVRRAYKLKLWAFVSDYVRLYALNKYGGIYLDTDVQLLKNFDDFLDNKFFTSIEGDILYGKNIPEPAIMGGEASHPLFKEAMKIYESDEIFETDNFIANVIMGKAIENLYGFNKIKYRTPELNNLAQISYNSRIPNIHLNNFELYRAQEIFTNNEISIYPCEYFCPTWQAFKSKAITDKTVAIHWNQSSWWQNEKIERLKTGNIESINTSTKTFYLFAFLPVLKEKTKELNSTSIQTIYSIFNIPIIKKSSAQNKNLYYLFNTLPIWKTKQNWHKKYHYLFQIIPILKTITK